VEISVDQCSQILFSFPIALSDDTISANSQNPCFILVPTVAKQILESGFRLGDAISVNSVAKNEFDGSPGQPLTLFPVPPYNRPVAAASIASARTIRGVRA
jgi:hypothetical protein